MDQEEEVLSNLKIVLTPWKTKEEFIEVYDNLFGDDANLETKKKAFQTLLIWRIRRCDGTPASILSTLELLNVELKLNNEKLGSELQTMYSAAFTKFINYMTSLTQAKQFKTLYSSAKELGLETFLIDLRHICAHGHIVPSMEVLIRSATYCMKWLKEFYWDRQLEMVSNLTTQNLRSLKSQAFENYVKEMYRIFDIASEAIHKGFETVEDKIYLHDGTSSLEVLHSYAEEMETIELSEVRQQILKSLWNVISKETSLRESNELVAKAILLDSHYFLTAPSIKQKSKLGPIELYQTLFRMLASVGTLEELFVCLIRVMENFDETEIRRQGAAYWANHILNGLCVMQKFKKAVLKRTNLNPNFSLSTKLINKENHSPKIRKIYEELGATPKNTLLFCDTLNRPIHIRITKKFLRSRLRQIDVISKEFCLRCIDEVEPKLDSNELKPLQTLVHVFLSQVGEELPGDTMEAEETDLDIDEIYTTEMFEKRSWKVSNDIAWSQVPMGGAPKYVSNKE